ncbi:MAG: hypothetical protein JOZ15_21960 [Acidobacteria bacterium]|nr:hypothetical protein [Acidobacteriota bacterium]
MSFGARFLRHPERFPERQEGEAWGGRELMLDLAGGPYHVLGLSPAQEAAVRATFPGAVGEAAAGAAVAASAVAAAIPIRLLRRAAGDFLAVDARGWEYGLDFDWSPAAVKLAGLGLAGRLDWFTAQPGPHGALWTCEDGGERFPGVFENFLRVLVAYRLLDLGGAVLHCAGVVKQGAAYLFLGRSGAGKTTVARLSLAQGAEVLSDDLNALIVPVPGGAAPAGTCAVLKLPFTGDLGERRALRPPLPLGGLLRLEQGAVDALTPLSRAATLACLLACAPFVNVDPHRRERLEQVLLALAAAAAPRAYSLRFSLAGGFWSIIERK